MMNKTIKGQQCTILYNSDDLKMLHVDSDDVYGVLDDINAEYENIEKMTITRGKIHKYLGMTIDYSSLVKVKFSFVNYIGNMLENISEDMKGGSSTPAGNNLLETAEYVIKLSKSDADIFHHLVAQLLYLSKQAQPDIQL